MRFRKGRSCIDQICTLRQILEQSQEWNASFYAVFVDFEKAFDSLHRESLWRILRHYGFPEKLVNVIKALYVDFECKVIHDNHLTESFNVNTGVKQGCILSPLLFSLAIDWIMRATTADTRRGIQWTLTTVLEDLDYADDLGLLSNKHKDAQEKVTLLAESASKIGLKVNEKKTQVMRMNARTHEAIRINEKPLEDVEEFVYLGSKITTDGDCIHEVRSRISKANYAFASLRSIWTTTNLSNHTKIRIFKSNVLSVLLYGSECWKVTVQIEKILDVFQTKCLRRILKIHWPNTISNKDLYERTKTSPLSTEVHRRRWKWLGHIYRMKPDTTTRTALRWTPQGKRDRGRPKETWRRTIEKDLKARRLTLQTAPQVAADRQRWRSLADASRTTQRREE